MSHFIKHKLALAVVSLGIVFVLVAPMAAAVAPTGDNGCPAGQARVEDLNSCCPKQSSGKYTAGSCLFTKYINPLISLLSALVGVVVVIGIIVGAIQFSSSAGDPQKATNGKNHIRNALIGLVSYLLLLAFLEFLVPGGSLRG